MASARRLAMQNRGVHVVGDPTSYEARKARMECLRKMYSELKFTQEELNDPDDEHIELLEDHNYSNHSVMTVRGWNGPSASSVSESFILKSLIQEDEALLAALAQEGNIAHIPTTKKVKVHPKVAQKHLKQRQTSNIKHNQHVTRKIQPAGLSQVHANVKKMEEFIEADAELQTNSSVGKKSQILACTSSASILDANFNKVPTVPKKVGREEKVLSNSIEKDASTLHQITATTSMLESVQKAVPQSQTDNLISPQQPVDTSLNTSVKEIAVLADIGQVSKSSTNEPRMEADVLRLSPPCHKAAAAINGQERSDKQLKEPVDSPIAVLSEQNIFKVSNVAGRELTGFDKNSTTTCDSAEINSDNTKNICVTSSTETLQISESVQNHMPAAVKITQSLMKHTLQRNHPSQAGEKHVPIHIPEFPHNLNIAGWNLVSPPVVVNNAHGTQGSLQSNSFQIVSKVCKVVNNFAASVGVNQGTSCNERREFKFENIQEILNQNDGTSEEQPARNRIPKMVKVTHQLMKYALNKQNMVIAVAANAESRIAEFYKCPNNNVSNMSSGNSLMSVPMTAIKICNTEVRPLVICSQEQASGMSINEDSSHGGMKPTSHLQDHSFHKVDTSSAVNLVTSSEKTVVSEIGDQQLKKIQNAKNGDNTSTRKNNVKSGAEQDTLMTTFNCSNSQSSSSCIKQEILNNNLIQKARSNSPEESLFRSSTSAIDDKRGSSSSEASQMDINVTVQPCGTSKPLNISVSKTDLNTDLTDSGQRNMSENVILAKQTSQEVETSICRSVHMDKTTDSQQSRTSANTEVGCSNFMVSDSSDFRPLTNVDKVIVKVCPLAPQTSVANLSCELMAHGVSEVYFEPEHLVSKEEKQSQVKSAQCAGTSGSTTAPALGQNSVMDGESHFCTNTTSQLLTGNHPNKHDRLTLVSCDPISIVNNSSDVLQADCELGVTFCDSLEVVAEEIITTTNEGSTHINSHDTLSGCGTCSSCNHKTSFQDNLPCEQISQPFAVGVPPRSSGVTVEGQLSPWNETSGKAQASFGGPGILGVTQMNTGEGISTQRRPGVRNQSQKIKSRKGNLPMLGEHDTKSLLESGEGSKIALTVEGDIHTHESENSSKTVKRKAEIPKSGQKGKSRTLSENGKRLKTAPGCEEHMSQRTVTTRSKSACRTENISHAPPEGSTSVEDMEIQLSKTVSQKELNSNTGIDSKQSLLLKGEHCSKKVSRRKSRGNRWTQCKESRSKSALRNKDLSDTVLDANSSEVNVEIEQTTTTSSQKAPLLRKGLNSNTGLESKQQSISVTGKQGESLTISKIQKDYDIISEAEDTTNTIPEGEDSSKNVLKRKSRSRSESRSRRSRSKSPLRNRDLSPMVLNANSSEMNVEIEQTTTTSSQKGPNSNISLEGKQQSIPVPQKQGESQTVSKIQKNHDIISEMENTTNSIRKEEDDSQKVSRRKCRSRSCSRSKRSRSKSTLRNTDLSVPVLDASSSEMDVEIEQTTTTLSQKASLLRKGPSSNTGLESKQHSIPVKKQEGSQTVSEIQNNCDMVSEKEDIIKTISKQQEEDSKKVLRRNSRSRSCSQSRGSISKDFARRKDLSVTVLDASSSLTSEAGTCRSEEPTVELVTGTQERRKQIVGGGSSFQVASGVTQDPSMTLQRRSSAVGGQAHQQPLESAIIGSSSQAAAFYSEEEIPVSFGPVPGVAVGTKFSNRSALTASGIHTDKRREIHRTPLGVCSLVAINMLQIIWDFGESLRCAWNLTTEEERADYEAFKKNMYRKQLIRVVRSWKVKPYGPCNGYRYDGLYKVHRVFETQRLNIHFRAYVELMRDPNQDPPKWPIKSLSTNLIRPRSHSVEGRYMSKAGPNESTVRNQHMEVGHISEAESEMNTRPVAFTHKMRRYKSDMCLSSSGRPSTIEESETSGGELLAVPAEMISKTEVSRQTTPKKLNNEPKILNSVDDKISKQRETSHTQFESHFTTQEPQPDAINQHTNDSGKQVHSLKSVPDFANFNINVSVQMADQQTTPCKPSCRDGMTLHAASRQHLGNTLDLKVASVPSAAAALDTGQHTTFPSRLSLERREVIDRDMNTPRKRKCSGSRTTDSQQLEKYTTHTEEAEEVIAAGLCVNRKSRSKIPKSCVSSKADRLQTSYKLPQVLSHGGNCATGVPRT